MGKLKLFLIVLSGVFAFVSSNTMAGQDLSADEVKALFSGKTFDGYSEVKKRSYKAYSDPNGTMIHQNKKRTGKFTWDVNDEGQHCAHFKKSICGKIVSMGGGVYHKIRDGKHINTLKNFVTGNKIE